jgi:hypothetical protein
MLSELVHFMELKPGLLKRAVVTSKRVVAWTTIAPSIVFMHWKQHTNQPLRLVPLLPREGGVTQETWNAVWDDGKEVTKGVRLAAS